MRQPRTILVTGGAGFIGSAVVRHLIRDTDYRVVNFDCLTYAANLENLAAVADHPRYVFERADICDSGEVARILNEHNPTAIMHLAAESHVDRSIDSAAAFVETNIVGTYTLLEAARSFYAELPRQRQAGFRFHHVSTDEVFGSLGSNGLFTEHSPYRPNSPYSASKAASDHFARAWHVTYGLPVVVSNCSNNYGPFQFPEKLIPLMIIKALAGEPLPVYGKGTNMRDWLFVADHAEALLRVLEKGKPGDTYNIGGHCEMRNIDVVTAICRVLDELVPRSDGQPRHRLITFVPDRPGHDERYAIDASKAQRELGWRPRYNFDQGLRATVAWYLENSEWWRKLLDGGYAATRLGLGKALS